MNKNKLMYKAQVVILAILAVLVMFSTSWATTYYIDATNGNDGSSGTSQATAWKTISKVNSSSFDPGDTILFKRGKVWREQLVVPSSGSSGNPITFGAYGTGDKPIINAADIITGWVSDEEEGEESSAWTATNQTGSSSWTNNNIGNERNYRIIIKHAYISSNGTEVRVKFRANSRTNTVVEGASIGVRDGSSDDFDGSPTRLKFDGNNNATITGGSSKWSDWVSFTLGSSKDHLVHTKVPSDHYFANLSGDSETYWKNSSDDDTLVETVSYNAAFNPLLYVEEIEVRTANVWKATAWTVIRQLFFDETYGDKKTAKEDLADEYDWYLSGSTLCVYSASDPDTAYTNPSIDAPKRDYGIYLSSKNYVTLENLDIKYTKHDGFKINGCNYITINSCDISRCDYYGMVFENSDHCNVNSCNSSYNGDTGLYVEDYSDYNTISGGSYHHNGTDALTGGDKIGIGIGGLPADHPSTNTVIEDAEVYNNYNNNIHLSNHNINNQTIQRCYIHDSQTAYGIQIDSHSHTGHIIQNNIIANNALSGIRIICGVTQGNGGSIYNNVIYGNGTAGSGIRDGIRIGEFADWTVKNNIIANHSNGKEVVTIGGSSGTLVFDHNCYYPDGASSFTWRGVDCDDFADWKSQSSQDANSIASDPKFVDAANDNFKLQLGAPCINAGEDVGRPYYGAAPDIGAFEYNGQHNTPPAPPTNLTII